MLGLDAGWNCHISLGYDAPKPKHDLDEENPLTSNEEKSRSQRNSTNQEEKKNLKTSKSNIYKILFKKTKNSKNNIKYNKIRETKNSSFYKSLPNVKFSKFRQNNKYEVNQTSQIVKFNLSNIDRKKVDLNILKKKKRQLQRLYSTDTIESTDSDSSHLEEKLKSDEYPATEINLSKYSVSSIKSNSTRNKRSKFDKKHSISISSKLQEDENSSHRTVHSGRTLSETEILGNTV